MIQKPLKVLLIEDDPNYLDLLGAYLEDLPAARIEIESCVRLSQALERLGRPDSAIDVILLDLGLPDSQGFETFTRVHRQATNLPIVVLSGLDDEGLAIQALREGAQDYLVKGEVNGALLLRSLHYSVERMRIEQDLRQARHELEIRVRERTVELALANAALKKMVKKVSKAGEAVRIALQGVIHVVARTIETRDPYTAGHQRGVANLAVAIARRLGLSEDRLEGLKLAATVHDLGKISIPAEILAKPSRLTEVEIGMIRTHPGAGYEILRKVEFPWPIAQMVLQHHERINGSGYPQGLQAPDILLEAKILGVADVVDAMCSHRPYRAALGISKALAEIRQNRGLLYDPAVVDACQEYFQENLVALPVTTRKSYKNLINHQPLLPVLL
jgi:HD-GYP domain-containing protein (c-di-GMP phosphodiesterase class II)